MNRDRIVQVRLDRQLATRLREFIERLRARDTTLSESVAVRHLLRQALADEGRRIDFDDAFRNEGARRAYNEARAALRNAFAHFFKDESEL